MTEKELAKYNALKQQLENCGRQVMNLRSEMVGMRDRIDTLKGALREATAFASGSANEFLVLDWEALLSNGDTNDAT